MNQGFRLRFDQMRDNNPTHSQTIPSVENSDWYPGPGHTRNVCLIWPDGRRMFFNYAYLIDASFEPNADMNTIQLDFSSHMVQLKGYRLDTLFMALLDHLPRLIFATDPRYVMEEDQAEMTIVHIQVDEKK